MSACILAAAAMLGACGQQQTAHPSPSASASPSTSASASPTSSPASLTAAEKNWLAQKGALQIGAFNDYPPFGFVDKNGKKSATCTYIKM